MDTKMIHGKIDRRRHRRFLLKNRVFAVVRSKDLKLDEIEKMSKSDIALAVIKSNPPKMGEITELSQGGLTFSYIENETDVSAFNEMDILFVDENFHLSRLPFIAVDDKDMESDVPFSALSMKQLSVKFVDLTRKQKLLLDHALKNFTIDEVSKPKQHSGKQVWSSRQ